MPRERWTGHRPIRAGADGQPGDVIAEGRDRQALDASLRRAVDTACDRHGPDVVEQTLAVRSRGFWRFACWFQGRECASHNEVADAAALPTGQNGSGHGLGIPVPAAGLRDGEVEDLLVAIIENPRILEEFAEWRTFLRMTG